MTCSMVSEVSVDADFPRVILVMLRRPRSDPDEARTDPLWEFGSFGTTGCHYSNLMHVARIDELTGKRFAFVQGGRRGMRLVHVTPPVIARLVNSGRCGEVRWNPAVMPLRYENSPCIADNSEYSDVPLMLEYIRAKGGATFEQKFGSAFRSRRTPVRGEVGRELVEVYERWRVAHPEAIAQTYVDALPWRPPLVQSLSDRQRDYRRNLGQTSKGCKPKVKTRPEVCPPRLSKRRC
jgi:hypothetical protein